MQNIKKQEDRLRKEQEKLNQLIFKSLNLPIAKNDEILKQSRKVDKLMDEILKINFH